MEIHGGLSQGFSLCDAGVFRDFSQHLGQNTAFQNQVAHLRRNRETLSLKLEPETLPECLGNLLENGGHSPLLGSPEMNLLKLGSPELERLIMTQQNDNNCHVNSHKHHHTSSTTLKDALGNKNTKVISPLISVKDLQFITETNEALESILPRANYPGNTHDALDQHSSVSYEIENLLEPLQQVPESFMTDRTLKCSGQKRSNTPSQQNLMRSRNSVVNKNEAYQTQSCSPIFRDCIDSNEDETNSILERLSNSDRMYDNNQGLIYDMNQPTMLPNRFRQPSNCNLEKDQNASFSMLPLPPIDLEVQEIVKRERKKLKNRVAASKCRKKKLEREAQLELRVQQLKDKNIELNALSNALRQQATELKQRIMEHINSGCQTRLVHY